MKIISFIVLLLLCACGAKGEYCTTVPYDGECKNGYEQVNLEGGGKCMITQCGDFYANYGTWSETEEGVIISDVQGDFSIYNGNYEWKEHSNARGIGMSGQVLKLKGSGEIGTQLFPLNKWYKNKWVWIIIFIIISVIFKNKGNNSSSNSSS